MTDSKKSPRQRQIEPTAFPFDDDEDVFGSSTTSTKGSDGSQDILPSERSSSSSSRRDSGLKNFRKATFSRHPTGSDFKQHSIADEEDEIVQEGAPKVSQDSRRNSVDDRRLSIESEEKGSPIVSGYAAYAKQRGRLKSGLSYCCSPLQNPITNIKDKGDYLAALASWVTILRIMGDLPDVSPGEKITVAGTSPPLTLKVKGFYQTKYTKKDTDDTHKKYTELFKNLSQTPVEDIPFLTKTRESLLEKVQYLCVLGIYRAELRDELYSQLCKQLTNNPSRNSATRGWILMQMFAGCFTPTERAAVMLLDFLSNSSEEHTEPVVHQMRRTFSVGTRGFPPSWLELQAAKNGKPILLPITLMGGQRCLVKTDAATTVKEACSQIAQKHNFKEYAGCSIYITLGHKVSCLGHGLHRIMDAISECEQHTKQLGMKESSSSWRFYFRREYFVPWHEPGADLLITELDYQQIMRGITVTEYKCDKQEILAMMAAQKFFIDKFDISKEQEIDTFLNKFLPEEEKLGNSTSKMKELLKVAHNEKVLQSKATGGSLKLDSVTFAKNKWKSTFSRFYDLNKLDGGLAGWTNMLLGVNYDGLDVMNQDETVKCHFNFIDIVAISRHRKLTKITMLSGEDHFFHCQHSDDFFELLSYCLHGLKMRSTYAVVIRDCKPYEEAMGSKMGKGDLVMLAKPHGKTTIDSVLSGKNCRTGEKCAIPRDHIYVLATTVAPPKEFMERLVAQLKQNPSFFDPLSTNATPHNLSSFAKTNFRLSSDNSVTKLLSRASLKKDKNTDIWKHTKDSMKRPLLRRTCGRDDLKDAGASLFNAVQQYMGDTSAKLTASEIDLANNLIIEPAIRSKYLRDELFVQMMKQLTDNSDPDSTERGWRLFFLVSSCVAPSTDVMEECRRFLSTRAHRFAIPCRERLEYFKREGNRIYPPQALEHDCVLTRRQLIQIQVIFPDRSTLNFDVTSISKVIDLKNDICRMLQLTFIEEYGIFLGVGDKVVSLQEHCFLMDMIIHYNTCFSATQHIFQSGFQLTVIFMRKLWINAKPGMDKRADLMFHFSQEIQNYMRGYHACSSIEAVKLAALAFCSLCLDEEEKEVKSASTLKQILPQKLTELRSLREWIQEINREIKSLNGVSMDEAKVTFLQSLGLLETYGSVFFEAMTADKSGNQNEVLVAINKTGIHIIRRDTHEFVESINFDSIPNWYYDHESFTLLTGEGSSQRKITLGTNLGSNMDDIIISYLIWHMGKEIKHKHRYAGMSIGESVC